MGPVRVLAALLAFLAVEHTVLAEGECVNEDLADRLAFKRKRRGELPRDFVKAQRHELSLQGGYYVSDLFSGTYVIGGAYAYHVTEGVAVEASFDYTHAKADVVRAVEDGRAVTLKDVFAPMTFVSSSLLLYPFHGKMQFGAAILHFDIHLDLGVGVVNSPTSRGVTGVGGLGFKLFLGKAFAYRIDVRDRVYQQELLDEDFIANDLSITTGLSLFLPLGF